jgi:putative NADPH-quinone reductase
MNILIIDGHPDPKENRFCHALARAYQSGAESVGHQIKTVRIADIEFSCLRSEDEYQTEVEKNPELMEAQQVIKWAEHIVIIYPLWLGDIPAHLKAFFEHVFSPDFAFDEQKRGKLFGKTARIIVTMGMPAAFYRWYFWSHSLLSLKRNILQFVGIKSVGETLIGSVETADHTKWLHTIQKFGRAGI